MIDISKLISMIPSNKKKAADASNLKKLPSFFCKNTGLPHSYQIDENDMFPGVYRTAWLSKEEENSNHVDFNFVIVKNDIPSTFTVNLETSDDKSAARVSLGEWFDLRDDKQIYSLCSLIVKKSEGLS